MRKIATLGVAAAAIAIATAAPASAAQGGFDHSGPGHAWIKVGRDEIDHEAQACTRIFGYGYEGYRPCDHFAPLLVGEKYSHPDANGYWAEWYPTTGQMNSGIW